MIIEDKITKKIKDSERLSDNLIYLADIEVELIKIKLLKKGKVKEIRKVFLFNKLWENNPGEENKKHFMSELEMICNIKENETMEIKKVTLRKEIACSSYKR